MTIQTRISDLKGAENPGVLSNVSLAKYRVNNSLVTSGLAVTGPEVDLLMSGGSYVQRLNFVNKVDTSTFNYSSDDFDEKGATGKITAAPYDALRHDLNWGWAYTDLTRIVTKFDIKGQLLTNAIPAFWSEVGQNIAVASIKGALAKATTLSAGAVTDTFGLDALIDASATLDDPMAQKTLLLSRKTLAKLQKLNKNAYVPAGETNLTFARWGDFNLVVTDAFGDNTTVIVQDGALVFSTGLVPGTIGMEVKRDADAGNGGGGEILRTRMSVVAHPQGFSYLGAAKPGLTVLGAAASWNKVADDAFIGFRAIKHAA
jgi:hypothetical protein